MLLALAAIWGASFMFIELALEDLEPTTLMAARLLLAAVALMTLLAFRRGLAAAVRDLRAAGWPAFALGVINAAIPFTLIAWGQTHVDSGVAAIANASVPIWVALLAVWWRESERATGSKALGIALGLAGVGILTGAQPDVTWWAAAGALAVVLASICYGIGTLLAQDRVENTTPLTLSAASTIGATGALLPFGVVQAPRELPDAAAVSSVVALGIAGTAIGMLMFFRIVEDHGSARAALVTYLLPVTALIYAAALLDEEVSALMIVGLALILSGVALGSGALRLPRREVEPAVPRA